MEKQDLEAPEIISHRMLPKQHYVGLLPKESNIDIQPTQFPTKPVVRNVLKNRFFKNRNNLKVVTSEKTNDYQSLITKYQSRVGASSVSQNSPIMFSEKITSPVTNMVERYLVRSIGPQSRSQTADISKFNRQEYQPKLEFV